MRKTTICVCENSFTVTASCFATQMLDLFENYVGFLIMGSDLLVVQVYLIPYRDVVKLTAQFVARNGRQFLTNLMNREQRNYQFDFLRPQHSLFNYFTKLVEQYTKVGPATENS